MPSFIQSIAVDTAAVSTVQIEVFVPVSPAARGRKQPFDQVKNERLVMTHCSRSFQRQIRVNSSPSEAREDDAYAHNVAMNLRPFIIVSACAALTLPNNSFAGWACGISDSLLPQVYALDVVNDRLEVYIGPVERTKDARDRVGSAITLDVDGEWTIQSDIELPTRRDANSAESCMDPPPDVEWLRTNRPWAIQNPYFEQHIGVCATGSDKRWGGISFYGGEGYGGAGGIVEQDIATGAIRYYRSNSLLNYSTSHLEYFGDHLWIGTAWYGECGTGMGIGVLSGFFANDELYADRTMGAGTCGFLVSDMLVHSDSLWIATELGLSKVSKSSDRFKKFEWTNYVPTDDPEDPMREVTCDELYAELLRSEDLASAPPNDDGYPYGVLWQRISKLRPDFAWQYVRKLNGLEPPPKGKKSD